MTTDQQHDAHLPPEVAERLRSAARKRTEGTTPMPITWGSTPADAMPSTRAMGFTEPARARSRDVTRRAAAPSVMPDEFPAVTVPPPALNTGRSRPTRYRGVPCLRSPRVITNQECPGIPLL